MSNYVSALGVVSTSVVKATLDLTNPNRLEGVGEEVSIVELDTGETPEVVGYPRTSLPLRGIAAADIVPLVNVRKNTSGTAAFTVAKRKEWADAINAGNFPAQLGMVLLHSLIRAVQIARDVKAAQPPVEPEPTE